MGGGGKRREGRGERSRVRGRNGRRGGERGRWRGEGRCGERWREREMRKGQIYLHRSTSYQSPIHIVVNVKQYKEYKDEEFTSI